MRVNIDGEHYLLLRSAFWAETSDVIGVYESAERAQEAAQKAAGAPPAPDRWVLETWSGSELRSSVQLD
ncbi:MULTISPECIES: hypothetical protein [unclassified Rathayibacter]|uniref:hypothetical protein n=1 Tax=unclassified Rathayibacter TaxID=2609250 RepID=UPI000CE8519B|nr:MULTISPECIES: hypothetical protein [unclassified Rathayibacter]PPF24072.1 hypothetical protein C5C54_16865 [Rathayibacter sp. AY1F2]PPG48983.1 hypothetical protein C5C41_16210 [Rathayibacter sp. AY1E9]PPH36825.1 hypothetical protein C5C86_15735 [Rathayibacter sp. AY1E4]PPH41475.1 hypothetical protein C5C42_16480 [Rathayibacter sp. AY1F7]PPI26933.1 hypothetical protein C5D44_06205 [Rathayibacter sp. AY1B5]